MPLAFLVLLLTLAPAAPAAEPPLTYAKDGSGVYGYKHTPKLPWCDYHVHDPDRPAPPRVNPGPAQPPLPPPSDAIILFEGHDLSAWHTNSWRIVDGCLETTGDLMPRSRETFGSFQLHLEWLPPANFDGPWYNRGNNGLSIHGLYEIQIFDSFNEKWAPDGQCAAIYGQTPPLVNACRPPGQWQTYDLVFTAPVLQNGQVLHPPRITLHHNGVLVHLNQPIHGRTSHMILPRPITTDRGPIALAGHGCPVRFRNLWIRRL